MFSFVNLKIFSSFHFRPSNLILQFHIFLNVRFMILLLFLILFITILFVKVFHLNVNLIFYFIKSKLLLDDLPYCLLMILEEIMEEVHDYHQLEIIVSD